MNISLIGVVGFPYAKGTVHSFFYIVLIRSEEDKDAYLKEEITHFWQLFLEQCHLWASNQYIFKTKKTPSIKQQLTIRSLAIKL